MFGEGRQRTSTIHLGENELTKKVKKFATNLLREYSKLYNVGCVTILR